MVTTNGAENSTENITENSTALNPIDTSTLRKKYQLAHTMFCDALLVPETLEAPSSEEEMIECALRVRQVLDIYFKPDLIFTPFVHRHFNTNRNIYYYLEQAENPYVDLELFRYYDYRDMEQISTLAEEFKRLYSGPNNLTKLDPKFISEMEMLEAEVKTTYEKIYASNNDINIVKTIYAKAITNVKGKTADNATDRTTDKTSVTSKNNKTDNNKIDSDVDRIENRFKAIKHRSIAYDGAFLKGFHMSLQIAKKANEGHRAFRGLWLLMKFYFAFSKQRRQDLNNLLENPKNAKKSLPAPYRKDVKAILEAKKREENARKAALELIKKREVLMLKERERKKQEEQQMLKKELEGGFNQLSGTDKKQLADIIQHPRSFHDRLKTADFCALVRQLPRFLLEPTTDGQKLVFNGKPIGGFHREHDKLLDGNVLQSFADVFRDLHVDVSLLTIRPSNAVRSSAKGKDTLDSNF